MPTGDALLSGYYLNELLLRLLARDDPHPALFDAYAAVVHVLAPSTGEAAAARRCGPSSCCCCARSACCRAGRADHHAAAPLQPAALQRWCPRAAW
jgi:hypothetical protein